MIRRTLPAGDLLITQNQHALQAGRLAALHREISGPREALIRAVALHDAGWPLFDESPEPGLDGRAPHVFDLPHGTTLPAWRRSVAVSRASGPLEALLVSLHFSRFSEAFAAEQADLQAAWRLGVPSEVERAGTDLIGFCDALSLRLLCDPDQVVCMPPGVTFGDGVLEPWPFAVDEISDTVVGRLLPHRRWRCAAELREAYAAAPLVPLQARFRSA